MNQRIFSLVTAVLFSWMAILHAIRLIRSWEVIIAGTMVPMWISWIGLIITAYLAYAGLRLSRSKPTKSN
jgi:hypothetical protein